MIKDINEDEIDTLIVMNYMVAVFMIVIHAEDAIF